MDNRERVRALADRIGIIPDDDFANAEILAEINAAESRGSASIADETTVERVAIAMYERDRLNGHGWDDPLAEMTTKRIYLADARAAIAVLSASTNLRGNEAIERAAQAACERYGNDWAGTIEDGTGLRADECVLPDKRDWRAIVRAALAAANRG